MLNPIDEPGGITIPPEDSSSMSWNSGQNCHSHSFYRELPHSLQLECEFGSSR
jgi:hypothetical protein